jgi:hypothetical protein
MENKDFYCDTLAYFDYLSKNWNDLNIDNQELIDMIQTSDSFISNYFAHNSLNWTNDEDNPLYFDENGIRIEELYHWFVVVGELTTVDELKNYLGLYLTTEAIDEFFATYITDDPNSNLATLDYNNHLFTRSRDGGCDSMLNVLSSSASGHIINYDEGSSIFEYELITPLVYHNDDIGFTIDKVVFHRQVYEFSETEAGWRINSLHDNFY